jgi:HEAT repeat protein
MVRSLSLSLALLFVGCGKSDPRDAAGWQARLHDSDPAAQAKAAYSLSKLGADAKVSVPELVAALKSPSAEVRQNAALALGQIGSDAAAGVPALTEALADPEWAVRRQAVMALGQIGEPARPAAAKVQALLHDANSLVAKAAREVLAKLR